VRPLYLDTDTEASLIDRLNEESDDWRDEYDDVLDAAEALIPQFLADLNPEEERNDFDYQELDFNE
jgi:hypothetical protein